MGFAFNALGNGLSFCFALFLFLFWFGLFLLSCFGLLWLFDVVCFVLFGLVCLFFPQDIWGTERP